ncbi:EamA family transporter [Viridibacillus sp. FSL H8-0123]|uniref:Transport protein n=1 Tax=Viridibacillus arenosi FSL R5-213 TaxID=1227360 RepID=W4F5F6_9BACL|nr:transport protein [Viridibacillus arenosi FSL R5-213]OMC82436.1 EamA family transporter [Viridibacillus sp. FSL H8-0123]OMC91364.1 EamA family transporter [Viridibacillus arenosi]
MSILPYAFVLLAAVLWGTVGTTQTFLTDGINPLTVAMMRSAVGGGTLLIIATLMRKIKFRHWAWKYTFFAALSMALFQPLFFSSVRLTGVAIGTVVTIGSSPVFAGLIDWLYFKNKPTRTWGVATLLAIVGCVLLFVNKGEATINPIGIAMALCAGTAFAIYTHVSKALMEKEEAMPAVAMTFSISALLLCPISLIYGIEWVGQGANWLPLAFMGVFGTSIAYLLFLTGLQKISSSSAVTLSLGEPLTATILGVFLVGEYLSVTSWFGVAMLLGGILVITFGGRVKKVNKILAT